MRSNRTRRIRMAVMAAALVPMLSGCQLLGLRGHGVASADRMERPLPDDFGAKELAAARQALVEGRTADAIEGYMVARLYPAQAADAFNGLAVAYSRIGRTDLTERFFRAAIALAPQDDRYRANLARFYQTNPIPRSAQPMLALSVEQDSGPLRAEPSAARATALADVTAAGPQYRTLAGGITVESNPSRLQRISANEVVITQAGPQQAATTQKRHQAVIEVGSRSSPVPVAAVRVGFAGPSARPAYPIRIELDNR